MRNSYDTQDTVVAIASARGAAERGIVRLSGPDALGVVGRLVEVWAPPESPSVLPQQRVRLLLSGAERSLPCDLFVWPDTRSYTGQPSAELHTVGSPPVLDALVAAACAAGARLAEPGEFTLRAFLAGRLDLTQAEAVLGVIDARGDTALRAALEQLAGGLSAPLGELRATLLGLLAELEAGLDFVDEEDVRFIEPEVLLHRLTEAAATLQVVSNQAGQRGDSTRAPRVVLAGEPNAGKSSLFNALRQRYGVEPPPAEALVSPVRGTTRDAVTATLDMGGVACELVDTAGVDGDGPIDPIDGRARRSADRLRQDADLVLWCEPPGARTVVSVAAERRLRVSTKCDLGDENNSPLCGNPAAGGRWATSAATGAGLEELAQAIAHRLASGEDDDSSAVVSHTAARCRESLIRAAEGLAGARDLAAAGEGEELVALELRAALDALGAVTGEVVTDDVLDQIFGKFCIGK
ncbi:tRNA modification GTPase MnmE [Pseudobythopirellula maris]|uniref:tRNA modification GTPase MnmE n=1 Tax=Pseudobythopirellula maris TaxID=2527991 RepID=A0A5C5ZSA1_9BACT|nr:GTPase [Pseudobythopirellula maris]TWT90422.1 tRNA modification GTPase MnmE [Pseudobythopirellula maris]